MDPIPVNDFDATIGEMSWKILTSVAPFVVLPEAIALADTAALFLRLAFAVTALITILLAFHLGIREVLVLGAPYTIVLVV